MKKLGLLLCLAALSASAGAADTSAVASLHALFDSAWERDLAESPVSASLLGDRRYDDRWADVSLAALERSHQLDRKVLEDLGRISRDALPVAEQLNYDLFEREYRSRVAAYRFKPYLYDISPREGVQTRSEVVELLPFATVKDYEDWIGRLTRVGTLIDQNIALLELALREGRTQPKVIMERVPAQIAMQVVAKPEDSPFYEPFKEFPESISAAERARLSAAGARAIADGVIPGYRRFQKFFNEKYLPRCRDAVGIWNTPEGGAYYQNRVEFHTTTRLTADEVHEIGVKEVARIRAEMDKIIQQVKFKGSFDEFLVFLRTDPQFYYKSSDELFEAYAALSKRIDPELVKLFGKLPRTP